MSFLHSLKRLISTHPPNPRGKEGARAYVVGDIHGRVDLLEQLLAKIEADISARARRDNFIVFLGDVIDRGPSSAEVVERLRTYQPNDATPIFLTGNHEEVMLSVLQGKEGLLASWLKFGGTECLESYGVDTEALKGMGEDRAREVIRASVPEAHVDFLNGGGDTFRFGDYLFVHAGIRPGVALDEQEVHDLRWIREPFLNDRNEHGFVVVHGHTITSEVDERPNRIGIDTGAYATGKLTALAIEDEARWEISTKGALGGSSTR